MQRLGIARWGLALCASVLLSTAGVGVARAVIIDFGGFPTGGTLPSYDEDGFRVSAIATLLLYRSDDASAAPQISTTSAFTAASLASIDMNPFDLFSIDLATVHAQLDTSDVTFTGQLAGGGTTLQTFTVSKAIPMETFAFNGTFRNLASVEWTFGVTVGDNIVVVPVPEPRTALLVAGGVIALAAQRRGLAIRFGRAAPFEPCRTAD